MAFELVVLKKTCSWNLCSDCVCGIDAGVLVVLIVMVVMVTVVATMTVVMMPMMTVTAVGALDVVRIGHHMVVHIGSNAKKRIEAQLRINRESVRPL